MIEIAPEEYCKSLTIEDAIFYCFSLNIDGKIGWRLPTEDEFYGKILALNGGAWDQSEIDNGGRPRGTHMCIPVRDLQDD